MPPRNRNNTVAHDLSTTLPENSELRRATPKSSRWLKRLGLVLIVLMAFVAILPNLVGWLGLHQTVLPWVLGDKAKQIKIDRLNLGWWQTVQVDNIQLSDANAQPLATVAKVQSTRTLWQLLTGREIGEVQVTQARVVVQTRDDGSNWEDELSRWQSADRPAESDTSDLPVVSLKLVDTQIEFQDAQRQPQATFSHLLAHIQTAGDAAVSGTIATEVVTAQQTGKLEAEFQLDPGSKQVVAQNVGIRLLGTDIDLSALQPILTRVCGEHRLAGLWSGEMQCALQNSGANLDATVKSFQGTGVHFAHPVWLGNDQLRLHKCVVSGRCQTSPQGIRAEQFVAESDFGHLKIDGELSWQNVTKVSRGELPTWTPISIQGLVDLKALVEMLPETMRLHPELQMESGRITLDVASRHEAAVNKWVVNLDAANLAARRGPDLLRWTQPLRAVAVVAQSGDVWEVSQLECDSEFLNVRGQANFKSGSFQATGDLAVLLERIQQFVDIPECRLEGALDAALSWDLNEDNRFENDQAIPLTLTGRALVSKPAIAIPGWVNWSTPEVKLNLGGKGSYHSTVGTQIEQANLVAVLGTEQFRFQLTQPLAFSPKWNDVVGAVELQGSATAWQRHLATVVELPEFAIEGQTTVQTQLRLAADALTLKSLQYQLDQAIFRGFGLDVQEQQISGTAEVVYDFAKQAVLISDATLVSSGLAARTSPLEITLATPLQISGPIAFRGDLNRLTPWFGIGKSTADVQYFGAVEGTVNLHTTPQHLIMELQASIPEVVAAQLQTAAGAATANWTELLREPQVSLQGKLGLSHDYDHLTIDQAVLSSSSLALQLQGTIAELSRRFDMNIQGTWQPDWQKVNGLLAAYSSNQVRLVGKQQQAFAVRGPLFGTNAVQAGNSNNVVGFLPPELEFSTQVAWDQGEVFLLPVGPAATQVKLQAGVVDIQTGAIPFGGGEITAAPQLNLNQPQWVVQQGAGTLANNVTITPEICRTWLKYVAPIVADATSAQGKFTVTTEGMQIPLDQVMNLQASGAMQLKDVTIGAGPLAEQLIGTVMSVKKMLRPNDTESQRDLTVWLRLNEQSVNYQVADGRVYHENLQIGAKEFVLKTRGSVGFDQTLSMVAEIPIPDAWIDGEKWLSGLKGQSIQIPIGGTVSRPVLDTKSLQTLTRDVVQKLAANQLNQVVTENTQKLQDKVTNEVQQAQEKLQNKFQTEVKDKVDNELKKGFDKLFGPKKDK